MVNLFQANQQWATRPDDERFWTPAEMRDACRNYAASARTAKVGFEDLRVEALDSELYLVGKTDSRARFTHYAFGQLCAQAKAPAEFMRSLPATLSAQVINNRIKARCETNPAKYDARLLFHSNGSLVTRAITSELYDRVWNYELLDQVVLPLCSSEGWRVPPARPARASSAQTRRATAADIIPNSGDFGIKVRVGDEIAPAGLYASDHDMFCALVHPTRVVGAGDRQLMRGMFISNSEVGDSALKMKFFLVDGVCGNHIFWGCENVHEISIQHRAGRDGRGDSLKRFAEKSVAVLRKFEGSGEGSAERAIAKARTLELGASKDEVLEALFKYAKSHSLTALTRSKLSAAAETAEKREDRYGNPRTLWAMVGGLTENAQLTAWCDDRTTVDEQAGRLMEMAF